MLQSLWFVLLAGLVWTLSLERRVVPSLAESLERTPSSQAWKKYEIAEIQDLSVVNAARDVKRAFRTPDRIAPPGLHPSGPWNAIGNGSFVGDDERHGGSPTDIVATIRHGKMDIRGDEKAWNRAGVAVVEDPQTHQRRVVICSLVDSRRYPFPSTPLRAQIAITQACGGSKVLEFMGGGALMVDQRQAVSDDSILVHQRFYDGDASVDSNPLFRAGNSSNPARHLCFGSRGGKSYFIVAVFRNGSQLRDDLAANDLRVPCGSSIVVRKVEMRDPEIKRPEQTFTRHILAPVSAVSLPCPERDRGQL